MQILPHVYLSFPEHQTLDPVTPVLLRNLKPFCLLEAQFQYVEATQQDPGKGLPSQLFPGAPGGPMPSEKTQNIRVPTPALLVTHYGCRYPPVPSVPETKPPPNSALDFSTLLPPAIYISSCCATGGKSLSGAEYLRCVPPPASSSVLPSTSLPFVSLLATGRLVCPHLGRPWLVRVLAPAPGLWW